MRSGCSVCGGGGDREHFHGPSTSQRVRLFVKQNVLSTVFGIAIMILCIYLSWTCNTKGGENVIMKVIYAFFAAFFNILYLIYYLLFRKGYC